MKSELCPLCDVCGQTMSLSGILWKCRKCGNAMRVNLDEMWKHMTFEEAEAARKEWRKEQDERN